MLNRRMYRLLPSGLLLLLSLLSISCQSEDRRRPFLDDQHVIAHAGGIAAGRRYTNSLEALESSYAAGFRLFEVDLNWTRDEELVLIHDWDQTWRRLFGQTGIPTLEEYRRAKMVDGLTSLTLDGAMQWLSGKADAYLVTDIKERNIVALRSISSRYETGRIIPQIYEVAEFPAARELGFPTLILTVYRSSSSPREITEFATNAPLWALTAPVYQIERGHYDGLLGADRPLVFTHTINDPEVWAKLSGKGVDAIYTDTLFIPPSGS